MKKSFLILFFLLYSFSFAQTSGDTIKGSINVKFLNTLVLEVCNKKALDSLIPNKKTNDVTRKCAEYQSSYLSNFRPPKEKFHDNQYSYRNIFLPSLSDRVSEFNKPKSLIGSSSEICSFIVVKYGKTTYGELANYIIDKFIKSPSHASAIFTSYPYGDFSCTEGIWEGQKGVYVTGVFSR